MNFTRFSLLAFVFFLAAASPVTATTYYVRVTGRDNGNGRSANNAWRTIGKAAKVVTAGDIVYVGAGSYQKSTAVLFRNSGTVNSPIRFIADKTGANTGDAGDVIILTPPNGQGIYTWYFSTAKHYQIIGFKFKRNPNAPQPIIARPSFHTTPECPCG